MPAPNERFGATAAVTPQKCSANTNGSSPQNVQCQPPLCQAAGTLAGHPRDSIVKIVQMK